jgi:RNA polymerase sigma-70 factor (ECF subfamily)
LELSIDLDFMAIPIVASDADLIARIVARDEGALASLYDRYGTLVFSVALHIVQDVAQAEEVTQDTFVKVWAQGAAWNGSRGKVTTWLITISRYTAIDRLRSEKRKASGDAVALDDILAVLGEEGPMDDPVWADVQILKDSLRDLPADQRQVLELAYFRDMSHTEMSDHLNVPLGTVKSRVRAGLNKLRGLWLERGVTDD